MKIMKGIKGTHKLQYIFTGTPRSGTGYISQLLTSAGVPIGHEMFYGMPGAGFFPKNAVGDSSWLAVPSLKNYKKEQIFHIVRDPLKTITSLYRIRCLEDVNLVKNSYSNFKAIHLPEIMKYEGLDRYIFFWLVWNDVAAKEASGTYKLENIVKNPKTFLKKIGIDPGDRKLFTKVYNQLPKDKYFTLKDLKNCDKGLLKNLKAASKRYGYNI